MTTLKAPFPYFGGKARAAHLVWERFGSVRNYVEPFFGSGAVLLNRPTPFDGPETVNDADGMVSNFWRAIKADSDAVADYADWPVNENDLHARHAWLVGEKDSLQSRLEGNPDFFDPKVAGWWVWGMACWIGGGFCSGKGPWQSVEMEDGSRQLVCLSDTCGVIRRRRVHLGNEDRGVNRKLVRSDNADIGVQRRLIYLGDEGRGVNRKLVHLGSVGKGVNRKRGDYRASLFAYFQALSERFRHVRVCCGDWSRVMTNAPLLGQPCFAPVGVFLDPPYADTAKRCSNIYRFDSESVAHAVRDWAVAHGDDPRYRICLAGFDSEHEMPDSWTCIKGKAGGSGKGFGNIAKEGYKNAGRERLWFSKFCLNPDADGSGYLFADTDSTADVEQVM